MFVSLLAFSIALAAEPEASAPDVGADPTTEATPAASPAEATAVAAPNPAGPPAATDGTVPAAPGGEASLDMQRARRTFRVGRSLARTGVVALPAGVVTAYAAFATTDDIFRPTTAENAALGAGLLAATAALPLVWTGVAVERAGLRRAGCPARGEAWRHAPWIPLALGTVAAFNDGEVIVLGVLGAWGTASVQHLMLQPEARTCKERRRTQP